MPIHFPIGPLPCLMSVTKGGGMCLKCPPPPLDPPMSIVCPSDESCISSPTISMHIIFYKKGKIMHTEGNIKQNGLLHGWLNTCCCCFTIKGTTLDYHGWRTIIISRCQRIPSSSPFSHDGENSSLSSGTFALART